MTQAVDPVVIASYARTPMGSFQGALSALKATELGAAAVRAAVERAGVSPEAVEQIFMGCVLPAGLGQAPARQAALKRAQSAALGIWSCGRSASAARIVASGIPARCAMETVFEVTISVSV